jgi:conserved hypothetical protein TIGR00104
MYPIGFIVHSYSDEEVKASFRGVEGYVEILPEYTEGLEHIEGFSHIILVAYLHKVGEAERRVLKVRHRRLERFGVKVDDLPEVGVFATNSPHRPNPIAISVVRLLEVKKNKLYVSGLDLYSGTPVLDIKPYDHSKVVKSFTIPKWAQVLLERVKERLGSEYSSL